VILTTSDKIHYLTNMFNFLFTSKEIIYCKKELYIYNSGSKSNINLPLAEFTYLNDHLFQCVYDKGDFDDLVFILLDNWGTKVEPEMYDKLPELIKVYTVEKRDAFISSL